MVTPLGGLEVATNALGPAGTVYRRHLRHFGARMSTGHAPDSHRFPSYVELKALGQRSPLVQCELSWTGAGPETRREVLGSEAMIQAMTGVMEINGRGAGGPRRVDLDVSQVATGVLASIGLLAGVFRWERFAEPLHVSTSALEAGLLLSQPFLTLASATRERIRAPQRDTGPPFRCRDGAWVEIECLDPASWLSAWHALGLTRSVIATGWSSYLYRYERGYCELPTQFAGSVARINLVELRRIMDAAQVSTCVLQVRDDTLRGDRRNDYIGYAPWRLVADDGQRAKSGRNAGGSPAPCNPSRAPARPLDGIRVIEVTRLTLGPLGGLLLRMLGAEVWRIEPIGGDPSRSTAPLCDGIGAGFTARNWGKASVEFDLRSAGGRADLADLLSTADVLLHNLRSDAALRCGLDLESVRRISPGLVHASASGWGDLRPAGEVATERLVQAFTSIAWRVSQGAERPSPSPVLLCDTMGALLLVEGVLAALVARERTATVCHVQTALVAAAYEYLRPAARGPAQPRHSGGLVKGPSSEWVIRVDDGHVVMAGEALKSLHWGGRARTRKLLDAIDARGSNRHARLEGTIAGWVELCDGLGIPCVGVRTHLDDVAADASLSRFLTTSNGVTVPEPPWRFAG